MSGSDVEHQWARGSDVLWRRSGRRIVLMTLQDAGVVTLAGSGTELWELLEEPATLTELSSELGAVYGVEAGVVASDLQPFLADLEGRAVLRRTAL